MNSSPIRVAVCADPPHEVPLQRRAEQLAEALGIPKTRIGQPDCDLLLAVTPERLELRVLTGEPDLVGGHGVYADLAAIDTTSPAGRRIDMPLLRAVGIKKGNPTRPAVIDCTAGLGEDAYLLAAHSCTVTALERQPVIATLLDDALRRASEQQPDITNRVTRHTVSALDWLTQTPNPKPQAQPDALLIDPMFPAGRKAKERKPMRVLRLLAGDDEDAPALLAAALNTGVHRVCVKRPLKAPQIENTGRPKPDIVYKGKAVRFDVYLNN